MMGPDFLSRAGDLLRRGWSLSMPSKKLSVEDTEPESHLPTPNSSQETVEEQAINVPSATTTNNCTHHRVTIDDDNHHQFDDAAGAESDEGSQDKVLTATLPHRQCSLLDSVASSEREDSPTPAPTSRSTFIDSDSDTSATATLGAVFKAPRPPQDIHRDRVLRAQRKKLERRQTQYEKGLRPRKQAAPRLRRVRPETRTPSPSPTPPMRRVNSRTSIDQLIRHIVAPHKGGVPPLMREKNFVLDDLAEDDMPPKSSPSDMAPAQEQLLCDPPTQLTGTRQRGSATAKRTAADAGVLDDRRLTTDDIASDNGSIEHAAPSVADERPVKRLRTKALLRTISSSCSLPALSGSASAAAPVGSSWVNARSSHFALRKSISLGILPSMISGDRSLPTTLLPCNADSFLFWRCQHASASRTLRHGRSHSWSHRPLAHS